ncbi:MAG: TspO/MBR family protein [Winogradskyella arenosi]
MKAKYLFIIFLILNFGGLAIGRYFMGDEVSGVWYSQLNKAPWTPPGWVFGATWSLIMLCFSIYLSYLFSIRNSKVVVFVYSLALLLNVLWNYLFFHLHYVSYALINIVLLTIVIIYFFCTFGDEKLYRFKYLLLPYILWLFVAISLNTYVVLYN